LIQAPFYDEIDIQRTEWHAIENLSHKINTQRRLIYYFDLIAGTKSILRVDESWAAYLKRHKEILISWTQFNLIKYLQRRNPGVSGIADKIETPTSRSLKTKLDHYLDSSRKINPLSVASLKFRIMMQSCKDNSKWEFEEIMNHQNKMLSILMSMEIFKGDV